MKYPIPSPTKASVEQRRAGSYLCKGGNWNIDDAALAAELSQHAMAPDESELVLGFENATKIAGGSSVSSHLAGRELTPQLLVRALRKLGTFLQGGENIFAMKTSDGVRIVTAKNQGGKKTLKFYDGRAPMAGALWSVYDASLHEVQQSEFRGDTDPNGQSTSAQPAVHAQP